MNPPSMAAAEMAQALNDWYHSLRPRSVDLVGDYAGRELFVLEGDSLLRHCFSDERIDIAGESLSL